MTQKYIYFADPTEEAEEIKRAEKIGAKIEKPARFYFVVIEGTADQIAKITGLTLEEVEEVARSRMSRIKRA